MPDRPDKPADSYPSNPWPLLGVLAVVGVGVGYERFTVDVDVDKDSFNGSLDWTYDGPMIFYNASF